MFPADDDLLGGAEADTELRDEGAFLRILFLVEVEEEVVRPSDCRWAGSIRADGVYLERGPLTHATHTTQSAPTEYCSLHGIRRRRLGTVVNSVQNRPSRPTRPTTHSPPLRLRPTRNGWMFVVWWMMMMGH